MMMAVLKELVYETSRSLIPNLFLPYRWNNFLEFCHSSPSHLQGVVSEATSFLEGIDMLLKLLRGSHQLIRCRNMSAVAAVGNNSINHMPHGFEIIGELIINWNGYNFIEAFFVDLLCESYREYIRLVEY